MRPLTVVTGIVLGSCFSITLSLAAVFVIFLLLGDEYARLQAEFDSLIAGLAIFLTLTAVSAMSFYAMLVRHAWQWPGQLLLWCSIFATGYYFWV